MKRSTQYLIGMAIFTLATVLQGVGVIRYIQRMSEDSAGVTLFVVTTVALAAGAVFFYLRWIKARRDEDGDDSGPSSPAEENLYLRDSERES